MASLPLCPGIDEADIFASELAKICETGLPVRVILDIANLPKEELFVEIVDISGKIVHNTEGLIGKVIDISFLAKGVYEIKIKAKDGIWNQKLIKQ